MKFLVDNQLPVALARYLEAVGAEARHVVDLKLDTATDRQIWDLAKTNNYIVISKDEDFFHLATLDSNSPALIWVRLGNCRKVALLAAFEKLLPQLTEALQANQKIIEVR